MRHSIKELGLLCAMTLLVLVAVAMMTPVMAKEQAVEATLSADTVKVGKVVTVRTKTKDVTYTSSDCTIAYVSEDGTVSGKKPGTVTIKVKKKGYRSKSLQLTVKKNKKLPAVRVACDEVAWEPSVNEDGFSVTVTNHASKKASRIVLHYTLQLEKESRDVEVVLEKVGAGKTKTVTLPEYTAEQVTGYTCNRIQVYAGDGVMSHALQKDTYQYGYGTSDVTAPVWKGLVGKNSAHKGQVYMTVYEGEDFAYTKYIQAVDDRDTKVSITVDDSALAGAEPGIYKIYFTATDKAGNTAKTYAKVNLRRKTDTLDAMAEEVLSGIIRESWTDAKKAEAIYRYIRKNYSYVDHSDKTSWTASAIYGLRYQSGDCFTYYAAARILLTRAGIPNIMIKKVDGYRSGHWWNLVYVKDGWYHFDTTPRLKQAYFCLLTDAQLLSYSKKNHNSHDFKGSLYPDRAEKQIKKLVYGKRY